mmetsp:Transcript_15712/g.38755  ORF Transcript_15712/g.38755 Transcript_15712/m.38755 type:complete len:211 (-) Transcript_15712:485-1117(-)
MHCEVDAFCSNSNNRKRCDLFLGEFEAFVVEESCVCVHVAYPVPIIVGITAIKEHFLCVLEVTCWKQENVRPTIQNCFFLPYGTVYGYSVDLDTTRKFHCIEHSTCVGSVSYCPIVQALVNATKSKCPISFGSLRKADCPDVALDNSSFDHRLKYIRCAAAEQSHDTANILKLVEVGSLFCYCPELYLDSINVRETNTISKQFSRNSTWS